MSVLGFILAICYIPGWTGYVIHPGWVILTLSLVWLLRERALRPWPFLLYACLSVAWTYLPIQAISGLWIVWIWCMVFELAQGEADEQGLYTGAACGVGVSTVLAIIQSLGWSPVDTAYNTPAVFGHLGSSPGLFYNANVFGEVCALLSIGLICYRRYWPLLATLPGLALSNSRAAVLALGVATASLCWQRHRAAGIVAVLALSAAFFAHAQWQGAKSFTFGDRLAIWEGASNGLTTFGRGPDSFLITYPVFAKWTDTASERPRDAHNEYLQLAYEYGIGSLLLVPILAAAYVAWGTPAGLVSLTFLIIATLGYPLHVPLPAFLGIFALGRCWRDRPWAQRALDGCGSHEEFWLRDRGYQPHHPLSPASPLGPLATDGTRVLHD